jgi:uncharacterized protein DUF4124
MPLVNGYMLRFFLASAVASALLAATPSLAQVYKWVDDKGVVNYSNEAPANRTSKVLDPKSVRVSTYSTDEPRAPAPGASEKALHEKLDRLERKLDAERYARQSTADAQTASVVDARWYERCVRDRRVDCDYAGMDPYYSPYYSPYYYGVPVVVNPRVRQRPQVDHRNGGGPRPVARSSAPARAGLPSRQM